VTVNTNWACTSKYEVRHRLQLLTNRFNIILIINNTVINCFLQYSKNDGPEDDSLGVHNMQGMINNKQQQKNLIIYLFNC
jgi:hypothetical protein